MSSATDGAGGQRSGGAVSQRRREVVRAAVALFAERGYKATSASDVAVRAGVSRRTFFNYFDSKDDILFKIDEDDLGRLAAAVAKQPGALSDLEAVAAAWEEFSPSGQEAQEGWESRERVTQLRRAAESSPVLRGKELELHLAYERALAAGLASRRGLSEPDTAARAAAAIGQALMHLVIDEWIADPKADRDTLIGRYFSAATDLVQKTRKTA